MRLLEWLDKQEVPPLETDVIGDVHVFVGGRLKLGGLEILRHGTCYEISRNGHTLVVARK